MENVTIVDIESMMRKLLKEQEEKLSEMLKNKTQTTTNQ